jgi:acyl-CoA-binding protein
MSLEDDFKSAQDRVTKLPRKPDNDELLNLYALFKQSTVGDVSGKRPGMLDMKGRAKFDAWSQIEGLPKDEAMKQYVDLVKELEEKYG